MAHTYKPWERIGEIVNLRGHHLRLLYQYYTDKQKLIDIEISLTKEYSQLVGMKATEVLSKIANLKQDVKFVTGLDDICSVCPLRNKETECTDQSYVEYDQEFLDRYDFKENKIYSSEEILIRLKPNTMIWH